MNGIKKTQNLPESDSTTSTNYGPPFEVFSTAIFLLRACKQNKEFSAWINHTDYEPWDDIVAKIDGAVLLVQLKHNLDLDKKKLEICLKHRQTLIDKFPGEKLIFAYFATTPDNAIRAHYSSAANYPKILNYILTNKGSVYEDNTFQDYPTLFCMNQGNVALETLLVKQSLTEYIGQQHLTEDFLLDIQTKFLDYVRKRYLRLIKGREALTDQEIRMELAYTILSKFKVEYKPTNVKIEVRSNDLECATNASSVVVFDHRESSSFKEQIWSHLMAVLEKTIAGKHLKQAKLNDLWMEGKIHMPLLSLNKENDKIILRALEIGGFEPKVIILRPRHFTIAEKQDVITILQNIKIEDAKLELKTDKEVEAFKFAHIDLKGLIDDKHIKLHPDSFGRIAKDYFKGAQIHLKSFIEAHDEFNFVNDSNTFGDETYPALFAAIKVKNVDVKVIRRLIELGADVNASILGGFRPISFAMTANRADIVELLLENGAGVDPADRDGMRPLFFACIDNKIDMAKLLIKYGADRNTSDVNGVRPLFMAYNHGNFEIFKLILTGLDRPAAANTQGNHIMHTAARDGSVECLKCVLACCPDVRVFMTGDVDGKTPLDLALEHGGAEFAQILKDALQSNVCT